MKLNVSLLIVSLIFLAPTACTKDEDSRRSPLTSIGAVTSLDAPADPDDPGIGGGIDSEAYFRNRYLPKLFDCTEAIIEVYEAWSDMHEFRTPLKEVAPGDALMHATHTDLGGLFELTYRVRPREERARVTVFFYSRDGARHEPAAIQSLLSQYNIANLQDRLDEALSCGNT